MRKNIYKKYLQKIFMVKNKNFSSLAYPISMPYLILCPLCLIYLHDNMCIVTCVNSYNLQAHWTLNQIRHSNYKLLRLFLCLQSIVMRTYVFLERNIRAFYFPFSRAWSRDLQLWKIRRRARSIHDFLDTCTIAVTEPCRAAHIESLPCAGKRFYVLLQPTSLCRG